MTEAREIWFARRWPVERGGARMVPVHWKGYAMFGVFVAAMVLGAIAFGVCAVFDAFAWGVVIYVGFAAAGVAALFFAVLRHSDNGRTYKDYRKSHAVG
jgi:hypothetical protein